MDNNTTTQRCYNSFSCIGAILIIIFVLGSIIWDICFTKPEMKSAIEEIRMEVKDIHTKLDTKLAADTIQFKNAVVNSDSIQNVSNK